MFPHREGRNKKAPQSSESIAVVAVRSIAWAGAGSRCYHIIKMYDKRYISPSLPRHYSTCTSCPCAARPKPRPPRLPNFPSPQIIIPSFFGFPVAHHPSPARFGPCQTADLHHYQPSSCLCAPTERDDSLAS
ncbi:hypothetical protein CCUS01_10844 [Colletotrichum cuscutae]|uniref:Uncharacterized protein n=1 Tax=Colletotrichum cuscutae TaxID=1209917 RepID=A0AAI9UAU2_9PEZI|nr:hypothetical protein CCUS01_10844 [Colletotrichum cuscutae]